MRNGVAPTMPLVDAAALGPPRMDGVGACRRVFSTRIGSRQRCLCIALSTNGTVTNSRGTALYLIRMRAQAIAVGSAFTKRGGRRGCWEMAWRAGVLPGAWGLGARWERSMVMR